MPVVLHHAISALAQAEGVVPVHVEDLGDESMRGQDPPVVAGEPGGPFADRAHAVGVVIPAGDDAGAGG